MKDETQVKADILKAANKLIQQYGIHKITMADIARSAGKGKSTLYYYFKSKDEIMDEVINQEVIEFFDEVKNAVLKENSPEAQLKTYLSTKVKVLKDKLRQYSIIIENESHYFDFNNYFKQIRLLNDKNELKLIQAILLNGIKSGMINPSNQEKKRLQIISEIILTCIRGVELEVFINKEFTYLEEKSEIMVEVLFRGLR